MIALLIGAGVGTFLAPKVLGATDPGFGKIGQQDANGVLFRQRVAGAVAGAFIARRLL